MSASKPDLQHWIGTREFSVRYGVSRPTVSRWAKQGRIRTVRIPPGVKGRMLIAGPTAARSWLCVLQPIQSRSYLLRPVDLARLSRFRRGRCATGNPRKG